MKSSLNPRDWPEDFPRENGNYLCQCDDCRESFTGYKRRRQCKVCFIKSLVEHADAAVVERADIRARLQTAEQQLGQVRGVLGMKETFTLSSVLKELEEAANHLFEHHNCDCHPYERWMHARDRVGYYQGLITKALNAATSDGCDGQKIRESIDSAMNNSQQTK